ncbi:response regulator [Goodfellowiella coeruleoviolacea]|uniref:response regulator n=1 Tax=Goodfellowiella coeruleoviolacea TaxID=334858 RepID=UPI0027DF923C|nr:response regulator [Goodfellowiella coeruleoviolacea]
MILDDHPAIVAGVRAWCGQADPPIELVDAGDQISRLWTEPGASADVVVFDLHLGRQPLFRELARLVDAGRQVVVYSQRADGPTARECVRLGAFTYLTKAEGHQHLVPAIQAAARNVPYTPPALSGAFYADDGPDRPALSNAERETLRAWFESDSKRLAAHKLHLSVKTVETYIERVRIKYANAGRPARTKAALLERAIQDGLVHPDELAG